MWCKEEREGGGDWRLFSVAGVGGMKVVSVFDIRSGSSVKLHSRPHRHLGENITRASHYCLERPRNLTVVLKSQSTWKICPSSCGSQSLTVRFIPNTAGKANLYVLRSQRAIGASSRWEQTPPTVTGFIWYRVKEQMTSCRALSVKLSQVLLSSLLPTLLHHSLLVLFFTSTPCSLLE